MFVRLAKLAGNACITCNKSNVKVDNGGICYDCHSEYGNRE